MQMVTVVMKFKDTLWKDSYDKLRQDRHNFDITKT